MCCSERGLNNYSFTKSEIKFLVNNDLVKTSLEEWAKLIPVSRIILPLGSLFYTIHHLFFLFTQNKC